MHNTDMAEDRAAAAGALAALSLAMLLASLGTSIANVALPALAADFGAPFARVQGVVIAYLAGLTLAAVLAGRLGDAFGRRRMLVAGYLVFALASALCGAAPSVPHLIAARVLQGAGAAFLMTLAIALLRETAGPGGIGRATGLLGTMSAVGTALGPSLGGLLLAAFDWRAVFLVLAPAGLLGALLAATRLGPDGPVATAARPAVFLSPGGLLPGFLANSLVAAVMMTTLIAGPFYLSLALHLPAAAVGLVMSLGPALSAVCGVPAGRLVDHYGAQRVLMLGLAALFAGCIGLAALPGAVGLAGYILAIAVLTPGYQLFLAANTTAVLSGAEDSRRGRVSGYLNLSRNLGLIAGASVMGAIFAFGAGTGALDQAAPGAIVRGMWAAFLTAALLIVLAALLSRRKKPG